MSSRKAFNRLKLGPIVGHTDETSTQIWIQVFDDPDRYRLRVKGVGLFPFESTEQRLGIALEFRTAVARGIGLRPDWQYHYDILRNGRAISSSKGTFRTMPANQSLTNLLFCIVSCNSLLNDGAWNALRSFVKNSKPHFIVMMGDQVYIDDDNLNVFEKFFSSSSHDRRKALENKYHENWSRNTVKEVMTNVPIYMMWDDHDIRDGWGSMASDSNTLIQQYPKGEDIFKKCKTYFEDVRDVYWHFQGCHNPLKFNGQLLPNYIESPPQHNQRYAMPYSFRCGKLVVAVLDSRGERDVFRKDLPILGPRQWQFIDELIETLPKDVDALAIMTPTPIASLDPEGQVLKLMGERTDDIESFKKGDFEELFNPKSTDGVSGLLGAVGIHTIRRIGPLGLIIGINTSRFRSSNINEIRDQWSHKYSRSEQLSLLHTAAKARFTNRDLVSPRSLIFLSGDIHAGCIYDMTFTDPPCKITSITSSGISTFEQVDHNLGIGTLVDEDFEVAPGIRSKLRELVMNYNFGVIQVIPAISGAEVVTTLAHEGNSYTLGLDIGDLL